MNTKEERLNFLFPHEKVREIQKDLVLAIHDSIIYKKNIIVHAPTGLGKTAAALGPALKHAIDKKLTVFFLTSRHTQHKIVIETLNKIKEEFNLNINVVSIIGKKWMCSIQGVSTLYTNEFAEYCRKLRENNDCEFYSNTKKATKLTERAKETLERIKQMGPCSSETVIKICKEAKLCPYEMSIALASKANVIVGDYYYIFNPMIRDGFLKKTGKKIEDSIIIVDEAHNLPNRVKDLATQRLSNVMLRRAIKEARKFSNNEIVENLTKMNEILLEISKNLNQKAYETIIKKQEFIEKINSIGDYDELIADLTFAGDSVREKQKQSYIGSIAIFLEQWRGSDEGFVRILSFRDIKQRPIFTLSYRCLDPSIMTKDVLNDDYCSILMSGTLTPTLMYKDMLGIKQCNEYNFKSPFPKENRINIIVQDVTTKFTSRSEEEYKKIAEISSKITNTVPGNSVVFFPSYYILDSVKKYFLKLSKKTIFIEKPDMEKNEKINLLEDFKKYKDVGAALLGVISGSFSEGIDLPGDYLKCVVIVGLPLSQPDLETKSLIDYYDKKFGKGWEYGYIIPAFNKSLQSAGRCIRSEKDKGAIVFMDSRYAWQNYYKYFPLDWNIKITKSDYIKLIDEFFRNNFSH
jgi:DNA excision repair protein ERCC-2